MKIKNIIEDWFNSPCEPETTPQPIAEPKPEPEPEPIGPVAAKIVECIKAGDCSCDNTFNGNACGESWIVDVPAGCSSKAILEIYYKYAFSMGQLKLVVSMKLGECLYQLNDAEQGAIASAFFTRRNADAAKKQAEAEAALLAYTPTAK